MGGFFLATTPRRAYFAPHSVFFKNKTAFFCASILAGFGILLAKLNTIVTGQFITSEGTLASYIPSIVEIGGMFGALALSVVLYHLGTYLQNKLTTVS